MFRITSLTFLYVFMVLISYSQKAEKLRVVVMTDITPREKEPDDIQSIIRYFLYANEFDTEGLIATTSCWWREKVRPDLIVDLIENGYRKVYPNLLKHSRDYPTPDFLLSKVKSGWSYEIGMEAVGPGKDSEASEWIIEVVDKPDPRPVWFTIWGGMNDLVQAIWKVRQTRTDAQFNHFISKIRVIELATQDNSGAWACKSFPELMWIRMKNNMQTLSKRMDLPVWKESEGGNFEVADKKWYRNNVQENHGPLGELYPDGLYNYEANTPGLLYLIPNGLNYPEHPGYGGWGGRFEWGIVEEINYQGSLVNEEEWYPFTMWKEAKDFWQYKDETYHNTFCSVFRWRDDFQHDFAARMDWSIKDFDECNHPPEPVLKHEEFITVEIPMLEIHGRTLTLDASGTTDPDGDNLSYHWFQYVEAGQHQGKMNIINADHPVAEVELPVQVYWPQTLHFICAITDDGEPALTRYKRVIIKVDPQYKLDD